MLTFQAVQTQTAGPTTWTVVARSQGSAPRIVWRHATKMECQAEARRLQALELRLSHAKDD